MRALRVTPLLPFAVAGRARDRALGSTAFRATNAAALTVS
jgi:hypothetical protein